MRDSGSGSTDLDPGRLPEEGSPGRDDTVERDVVGFERQVIDPLAVVDQGPAEDAGAEGR
jgi:hypothetical protein